MSVSEEKYKTSTSYMLPFEKMHGLGNDFVVINNLHLPEDSNAEFESDLALKICNRHLGIGADGLIIIDNPKESQEACKSWRFYNSDGSIAEMCGNGIRCAAKYIYEHGLSFEETKFSIETLIGDISISLEKDEMVKVNMGRPREIIENQELTINNFHYPYTFVSMGNPHAVSFWKEDLNSVKCYGPDIEIHPNFPKKTNVEFAKIIGENLIELIVWERGCGFTNACGTGACATAVASILKGYNKQDQDIVIKLPGGPLIIRWDSVTESIFMTGEAKLVFMGYYNL
jgi:diaminopimelate epimerase